MTWRYDKIKAANSTNTAHAIGNVYHDAIAPTTASVIKICSDHRATDDNASEESIAKALKLLILSFLNHDFF